MAYEELFLDLLRAERRVPLDKSEGVVKAEFTWAVREHRMRRQIGLRTKHLGITR